LGKSPKPKFWIKEKTRQGRKKKSVESKNVDAKKKKRKKNSQNIKKNVDSMSHDGGGRCWGIKTTRLPGKILHGLKKKREKQHHKKGNISLFPTKFGGGLRKAHFLVWEKKGFTEGGGKEAPSIGCPQNIVKKKISQSDGGRFWKKGGGGMVGVLKGEKGNPKYYKEKQRQIWILILRRKGGGVATKGKVEDLQERNRGFKSMGGKEVKTGVGIHLFGKWCGGGREKSGI